MVSLARFAGDATKIHVDRGNDVGDTSEVNGFIALGKNMHMAANIMKNPRDLSIGCMENASAE